MINNKGLKLVPANMTDLSIIHEKNWNEYYVAKNMSLKAVEACERFLHSASLLTDGEFLGLQIDTKTFSSAAFSSPGKKVTMEDIAWIFDSVADTSPLTSELVENLHTDGRKVYMLSSAAVSTRDVDVHETRIDYIFDKDGNRRPREKWLYELFEKMSEIGAVIRIIACGTMENTKDHGMILISLPDKMTLRMRSMLSIAFPHLVVDEVDKLQYLSDERFLEGMHGMLFALMSFSSDQKSTDETEDDEDTPIDELKLSIRSYNCLKRSGINTVEVLQSLSDEDLKSLRNMGRKCIEEIKQKLAEFQTSASETETQTIAPEAETQADFPETETTYMEKLDELVGLTDVKEQIRKIAAFAKMKKDMSKNGNADISLALNMGFVGKPGTAKTTVARIAAGIFHEIGLLPSDELIEVGRADLVAGYVGQTAIRVQEVFMRAEGKVLFIDEAYSLADGYAGYYGDEAINTLVQEMENNRDKTIVIFAGYPDEMESFFSRNPGLNSRVPFIINFSDYSAEDMVKIAELEAKRRGFSIDTQAHEKVSAICSEAALHAGTGNGRFCRNLVENAILGYASRLYGNEDGGDDDKNCILTTCDFTYPIGMNETKKNPIGFHA